MRVRRGSAVALVSVVCPRASIKTWASRGSCAWHIIRLVAVIHRVCGAQRCSRRIARTTIQGLVGYGYGQGTGFEAAWLQSLFSRRWSNRRRSNRRRPCRRQSTRRQTNLPRLYGAGGSCRCGAARWRGWAVRRWRQHSPRLLQLRSACPLRGGDCRSALGLCVWSSTAIRVSWRHGRSRRRCGGHRSGRWPECLVWGNCAGDSPVRAAGRFYGLLAHLCCCCCTVQGRTQRTVLFLGRLRRRVDLLLGQHCVFSHCWLVPAVICTSTGIAPGVTLVALFGHIRIATAPLG